MEVYGKNAIYLNMDISATYTTAITPLIPFFSAIACGILVAFSLQDCLKREERKLKRLVLFYFSMSGIGWFVTYCYEFAPALFVWLNIACLASFVLPAIFFTGSSVFSPGSGNRRILTRYTIFCPAYWQASCSYGRCSCLLTCNWKS